MPKSAMAKIRQGKEQGDQNSEETIILSGMAREGYMEKVPF